MGNQAVRVLNTPIVVNTNGDGMLSTRRFGVFELDLRAGELRRNGTKVKLQEQPFQVLAELIERSGQVVTREELRNRLWPADTYVDFDHGLNAAIRRLRDALGDSAENPIFVETVARRGYRFLSPVTGVPPTGSAPMEVENLPAPTVTPVRRSRHWWIAALVSAVVLVLIGLIIGFRIASPSASLGGTVRLTANPVGDPVRAAAISPDGRHIAFSDDTGLYLRQIKTGETHAIPLPEGMWAFAINWAPDNDHVIVALAGPNDRVSSLWDISVLGGAARKVVDQGSQPSVSPDGKQIAFVAGPLLHRRIWLAAISGDSPRELLGADGDLFGNISWSPDGSKIAYTTARYTYGYGTKGTIAVADVGKLDVAGERVSASAVLSAAGLDAPMVWTPDGRLIYTLQEQRPRQEDSNLWSIGLNADGKTSGTAIRLTDDQGYVFNVSTASDSKRVTYVKGVPQPDVYVAKLQPSGAIDEPRRLTLDDRRDYPYDWTPDNKSVIFTSDRTGVFGIYRQSINESLPELLLAGSLQWMQPRMSPDGTQILYLASPNRSDSNYAVPLMSIPVAGGPSRELAKAKWISNLQCARAPANVCVYSVINDAGLTFFRFDALLGGGTQFLRIKDELAEAYNWTLSPDGTTLAIAKGKWGSDEEPRIRLVSLDGGPDHWLIIHGWPGFISIDWAADSKSIWAATAGEKENALLRIDLQGNARVVWRPKNVGVSWAIPSRDGKMLALHVHSSSANVWMLDH
ncbi:MAG TPA: winged helix-turn-helix domain-containing protein [Candidatus Sulfotelmatobacter sp.]|nr:winged helix-turn-helix domain-containing protein [Candidatus Sulfotelmatobacter sp.]